MLDKHIAEEGRGRVVLREMRAHGGSQQSLREGGLRCHGQEAEPTLIPRQLDRATQEGRRPSALGQGQLPEYPQRFYCTLMSFLQ